VLEREVEQVGGGRSALSAGGALSLALLGVKISPMGVWRVVRRLGEAAARHSEGLSQYYIESRCNPTSDEAAPPVVVGWELIAARRECRCAPSGGGRGRMVNHKNIRLAGSTRTHLLNQPVVRNSMDIREAYNMIPGRHPQSG